MTLRGETESSPIVDAVNVLRSRIEDTPRAETSRQRNHWLAGEITRTPALRHSAAAAALADDLSADAEQPAMLATKRHINDRVDNVVFSLFSAAYFPTLGLDYLEYDAINADPMLTVRYPSPTVPVQLLANTVGFADRMVVALFPENHIDGDQQPHDLIFYFIDKFVSRHSLTRRLITEAMAADSFPLLATVDDEDVKHAAAAWVQLHEFQHRTGNMPIPQFLKPKSYKPLAGLEEMRVDVKSMLVCLDDDTLDGELSALTFEFILAERLLRYSVEGIPNPNYDAVSSQLLFNYLRKHNALTIEAGRIVLDDDLRPTLVALIENITELEDVVLTEGVDVARSGLIDFTREHTRFDTSSRQFLHIPFFEELKGRISA